MRELLALWADKLAGNFRSIADENRAWRQHHHKRHWVRVLAADNWFRGKYDNDGKLHALKNYWVEYVRQCGRTVAEVNLWVTLVALFCAVALGWEYGL